MVVAIHTDGASSRYGMAVWSHNEVTVQGYTTVRDLRAAIDQHLQDD
jgi:hypothetical protein